MPVSESVKRAVRKYDARMTRQYCLKLNLKTDADVIAKFASVPNIQGYVKELVLADIGRKTMVVNETIGKKEDCCNLRRLQ